MDDEDKLLIYSFIDALSNAGYDIVKTKDGSQHILTEREAEKIMDEM